MASLFETVSQEIDEARRPGEIVRIDRTIKIEPIYFPPPWCRVCGKPVERNGWDRYAGQFWGFWARCHGELTGGLIEAPCLTGFLRLEVFCRTDPHTNDYLWWVNDDGSEVQPPRSYMEDAHGHGMRIIARYAKPAAAVMTVASVIWTYRWLIYHG